MINVLGVQFRIAVRTSITGLWRKLPRYSWAFTTRRQAVWWTCSLTATLAGYDSQDDIAASAIYGPHVNVTDYRLTVPLVRPPFFMNRVELSLRSTKHLIGLLVSKSIGYCEIKQNVIGVKVRLYGEAVYSLNPSSRECGALQHLENKKRKKKTPPKKKKHKTS